MANIGASIGHNLRNLARFSGRDTRAQFWPWAIAVFIGATIATMAVIVPILLETMIAFQQLIHQPVDPKTGVYPPPIEPDAFLNLMPDFARLQIPFAAINAIAGLLLAAAVARRLHDRDKSGFWGLIPVPFFIIGALLMPQAVQFGTQVEPGPLPVIASLNSALTWVAFIGLIVVLVGESTPGPNRYGDPETA